MNLFEMVIQSTKVLLKPRNLLSTYNQTKIRYHIVTEPSYKEMQFEGNDSVIRHGVVTAQTPTLSQLRECHHGATLCGLKLVF